MNLTATKATIAILKHHGLSMCIVGDLALNYYNVPCVYHDLEICVSTSNYQIAAGLLCSTGLFEPCELDEIPHYDEYKRGFPRVRTTASWIYPPQTTVIFPASFFNLDPIENVLIPPSANQRVHISKEISDLIRTRRDLADLPFPRLPSLLKGLAKRHLALKDSTAITVMEDLVNGMNLDEAWAERNLQGSDATLMSLIMAEIRDKKLGIPYFPENIITCFIADEEEADNVRLIPGFE